MASPKKTIKPIYIKGIISDEVGDHSKDPFVIKKVEAAKKRLERVELPKELLKKNNK